MPVLSVVTAGYKPTAEFLPEAIESVAVQELPPGWVLEWIFQEDGDKPGLAGFFESVEYAQHESNGAQLGVATTRNLALARATGDLVQVLDQDDILLPGALGTLIPLFEREPIHWAIGQADDLMPSGQRVAWESAMPYGVLEPGAVNRWASEHGGNWPIHCANLMMRTSSVRALGGWGAGPTDDDLILFAALSELTPGYNVDAVTWLYRQHAQQAHLADTWRTNSANGRRIAMQRVRALKSAGLVLDSHAPLVVGQADLSALSIGQPLKEAPPGDL